MIGIDPESPIPLDVLCLMGDPGVAHVLAAWQGQGIPTAISGDPHFRPPVRCSCMEAPSDLHPIEPCPVHGRSLR